MPRQYAAAAAKELHDLLSSLCVSRILKYASARLLQLTELRERLQAQGSPLDSAAFLRMRGHGWLRAAKPHDTAAPIAYWLIPAAPRVLKTSVSGLNDLVDPMRR